MAVIFPWQRKMKRRPAVRCAAVVAAAGAATRMGGEDKVLAPLGEQPVLLYSLSALEASEHICEIVVVTREDLLVQVSQLCKSAGLSKVTKVVVGGASRAESVLKGLREVSGRAKLIAIQDGARPFVTQEIIDGAVFAAERWSAAAPAVPVKDTVKEAADGRVVATPDRDSLFAVQTPQVFDAELIRGALGKAVADGEPVTDDCSAVERIGIPVILTAGSYENIKITTPVDLAVAEAILKWREKR